jgi:hypothetical protein
MKQKVHPVVCRCGHDHEAHEHYRPGTDCALCECKRWNPPHPLWRRLRPGPRKPAALSGAALAPRMPTDVILAALPGLWRNTGPAVTNQS